MSAVIPVRDRAELVGRAIDSCLAQRGVTLEVIVVDDGSSDATPAVLETYGDRIVRIRQEGAGRSSARNAGIARARGEWIAFLDSDDVWLPEKLQTQLAFHHAHPELGASAHGTERVRADGSVERRPLRYRAETLRRHPTEVLIRRFGFVPSVLMVRAAIARQIGGFRPEYHGGEDLDFALRLARATPLGAMPECLTRMFEQPDRTPRRQLAVMNARVIRWHLDQGDLDAGLRRRLRRKVARYLVSIAKRTPSRAEAQSLLAEAVAIDPWVRRRRSYLAARWGRPQGDRSAAEGGGAERDQRRDRHA